MRLTLVSRESLGQSESISTVVRPLTIATALRTVEIDSDCPKAGSDSAADSDSDVVFFAG